jgi:RHS repeat-associated protein
MKFAGEYSDPTGLYYLRAREQDPSSARFLAVDPAPSDLGDPAISSYVYADDRPTILTDPGGEDTWGSRCSNSPKPGIPRCLVYPFPKKYPKRAVQWIHPTGGLSGYWAIDFGAPAGATVLAVTSGRVRWGGTSHGGSLHNLDCKRGIYGYNFYLKGDFTGIDYFYTHLKTRVVKQGEHVTTGDRVGTIVDWEAQSCARVIPNHLHLGALGPKSDIVDVYHAQQVQP